LLFYPGEQRVEAVDFLSLGDVGVVLSNALQSQLLHQVDLIRFLKVLGLQQMESTHYSPVWMKCASAGLWMQDSHHELLNADGEGCRVQQDLPVLGQEADDILDEHHKVLRQQLIRLKTTAERHQPPSSNRK